LYFNKEALEISRWKVSPGRKRQSKRLQIKIETP
jgi:hypothetical protein